VCVLVCAGVRIESVCVKGVVYVCACVRGSREGVGDESMFYGEREHILEKELGMRVCFMVQENTFCCDCLMVQENTFCSDCLMVQENTFCCDGRDVHGFKTSLFALELLLLFLDFEQVLYLLLSMACVCVCVCVCMCVCMCVKIQTHT